VLILPSPQVLHTNQEYDVIVKLRVPESDTNRDVGMFMATARLLNHRNETIHVSSRPVRKKPTSLPLLMSLCSLPCRPH